MELKRAVTGRDRTGILINNGTYWKGQNRNIDQ